MARSSIGLTEFLLTRPEPICCRIISSELAQLYARCHRELELDTIRTNGLDFKTIPCASSFITGRVPNPLEAHLHILMEDLERIL